MSNKKGKAIQFQPPRGEAEAPPPVAEVRPPTFSFPSRARCPRCGSTDTHSDGVREDVQYRKCQKGVCRHSFKVYGTSI